MPIQADPSDPFALPCCCTEQLLGGWHRKLIPQFSSLHSLYKSEPAETETVAVKETILDSLPQNSCLKKWPSNCTCLQSNCNYLQIAALTCLLKHEDKNHAHCTMHLLTQSPQGGHKAKECSSLPFTPCTLYLVPAYLLHA